MYFSLSPSSLLSTLCFLLITTTFLSAAEIREFEEIYNANNCAQLITKGINTSGIYNLNVKVWQGRKKIQVYCDMDTEEGGWTLIQRRKEINGRRISFSKYSTEYATGFGDLSKEFWLGNDNIHILTAADDLMLRVELEDFDGNKTYAHYEEFFVENNWKHYRLSIGNYSGNAGDGMSENNGKTFFTLGDPFAPNCTRYYKSGWWWDHRNVCITNLNGDYSTKRDKSYSSLSGLSFWNQNKSLKTVDMKIRPIKFKFT